MGIGLGDGAVELLELIQEVPVGLDGLRILGLELYLVLLERVDGVEHFLAFALRVGDVGFMADE